MAKSRCVPRALIAGGSALVLLAMHSHPAAAQEGASLTDRVAVLERLVHEQDARLQSQAGELRQAQDQLRVQQAIIDGDRRAIASLRAEGDVSLAQMTARGDTAAALAAAPITVASAAAPAAAAPAAAGAPAAGDAPVSSAGGAPAPAPDQPPPNTSQNTITPVAEAPSGPVGEAPPPKPIAAAVLPQGINVLTAPGHFVWESAVSYVASTNNLLVFRGIQITPAVELGLIDANNTARNQTVAMETLRFGLFPRFEVEALVPYAYGTDSETTVQQMDSMITNTKVLTGSGIGDVELTGRYQVTSGGDGMPIIVANLRVKPQTGTGPFDVKRDLNAVALTLPTGSGFLGIEPSLSMLYTSDPAVIFASIGYLYNVGMNVNKYIGGGVDTTTKKPVAPLLVGEVQPGGSVDVSFGFAFALNQRFSFSLGFRDSYIFDTRTQLDGVFNKSPSLQVGALLFGTSFRLTDRLTVAGNFEFGVTRDAPNLTFTLRLPLAF